MVHSEPCLTIPAFDKCDGYSHIILITQILFAVRREKNYNNKNRWLWCLVCSMLIGWYLKETSTSTGWSKNIQLLWKRILLQKLILEHFLWRFNINITCQFGLKKIKPTSKIRFSWQLLPRTRNPCLHTRQNEGASRKHPGGTVRWTPCTFWYITADKRCGRTRSRQGSTVVTSSNLIMFTL